MSTDPTRLPDVTVDASGNLVEVPPPAFASPPYVRFMRDGRPAAPLADLRAALGTLRDANRPASVAEAVDKFGYDLETGRRICATIAAASLARAARRQASLAYLIRVGSEVQVNSGRRVPYGFYRVLRHYNSTLNHGNARVDLVASDTWRKNGYRVEDRPSLNYGTVVGRTRPDKYPAVVCAVANVKPVPDWSYPFREWGPWAVLGGVALTGFDGTAWSMLGDLIEDWQDIPPLPASVTDVFPVDYPTSYLAAELRDTIGHLVTGRAFQGPVYATPEVLRANENPS